MTHEDTNEGYDVYLRDTFTGKTSLITPRLDNNEKYAGAFEGIISDDGKWIVFLSQAHNIVPNNKNNERHLFLHNLPGNTTKRISVAHNGEEGNDYAGEASISSDGRFIAYQSYASNLVPDDTNNREDIFIYDSTIGLTRRVNRASADGQPATTGHSNTAVISGDCRAIMFISNDPHLTPATLDPDWQNHTYLVYNPVVQIPFYDKYDVVDLLKSFR